MKKKAFERINIFLILLGGLYNWLESQTNYMYFMVL